MFQQRGWAITIGHDMAKALQARGAKLAAMTFKRSTDIFVRNQSEVAYESIWSDEEIEESPTSFLKHRSPTLSEVCNGLGLKTIWEIVQSRRTQVRSYGEGFYYKNRQNVGDEHIENYVKAMFVVFEQMLDEFEPDAIVVPIFGGLPHIILNRLSRRRGIPMIGITDTKVYGILTFTYSYFNEICPFVQRVDQLNDSNEISEQIELARDYIAKAGAEVRTTREMEHFIATRKKSLYRTLRGLAGELKESRNSPNYVKGLGPSVDARPYRIVIRDFVRRWQYERAADGLSMPDINPEKEFAFFPLQAEPEVSIDVYAPRFNNQLELARQLAMSLPGDMKLIAKDHPVMRGYRSGKYLDKLDRTPNVLLVNSDFPSSELIRKSKVVITTAGTVAMEAALLKTPVIQLGDIATTLRLPNTTHHSDLSTMSDVIAQVVKSDFEIPEYERRLLNYVAAAYEIGFGEDHRLAWEDRDQDETNAIINRYLGELESCLA